MDKNNISVSGRADFFIFFQYYNCDRNINKQKKIYLQV